jgi:hypothetical protein
MTDILSNLTSLGKLFDGRHVDREIILLCVRWYLRYKLSLRNLVEMMAERGVSLAHAPQEVPVGHDDPAMGAATYEKNRRIVAAVSSANALDSGTSAGHVRFKRRAYLSPRMPRSRDRSSASVCTGQTKALRSAALSLS